MNLKTLLNSDNYQSSIETILRKCSHKTQVKFALHCAEGLEQHYDFDKYPEIKKTRAKCLELVANWLLDSSSVTKKELETAAYAANAANAAAYAANAANAAANAAYAAAYAAYAANAANAAANAAYAANAAANAANAANYDESVKQNYLKDLFYYLVKLHLIETDTSFKEETFNLLYLTRSNYATESTSTNE